MFNNSPPPKKKKNVPLWDLEQYYKARQTTSDSIAYAVHDHPLYLECPDVLCTVGETSYRIRVGFVESDTVFTVIFIIYLFICKTTVTSLQN